MVYSRLFAETAIFRVPGPRHSGAITRLIGSRGLNGAPRYSPDATHIVFMSDRTGFDELWVSDSEGQNARQLTSFGRATLGSPRWSPDSRLIAFDSTAEGPAKIYLIGAEAGAPRRITSGGSSDVRPSWSRDGAWIYFGSNRSGAWEIWKISPQGTVSAQVTHDGGREAFEDPDGRFLYYVKAAPTPGIWRMPLSGGPAEPVCDEGVQGQWGIGRRGLYYLNGRDQLEMLEFSTDKRLTIPAPGLRMSHGSGGVFGIAPDDRWLLVTIQVRTESDLSIVENFH
jgi:Tol biopolymer transport system component